MRFNHDCSHYMSKSITTDKKGEMGAEIRGPGDVEKKKRCLSLEFFDCVVA